MRFLLRIIHPTWRPVRRAADEVLLGFAGRAGIICSMSSISRRVTTCSCLHRSRAWSGGLSGETAAGVSDFCGDWTFKTAQNGGLVALKLAMDMWRTASP